MTPPPVAVTGACFAVWYRIMPQARKLTSSGGWALWRPFSSDLSSHGFHIFIPLVLGRSHEQLPNSTRSRSRCRPGRRAPAESSARAALPRLVSRLTSFKHTVVSNPYHGRGHRRMQRGTCGASSHGGTGWPYASSQLRLHIGNYYIVLCSNRLCARIVAQAAATAGFHRSRRRDAMPT